MDGNNVNSSSAPTAANHIDNNIIDFTAIIELDESVMSSPPPRRRRRRNSQTRNSTESQEYSDILLGAPPRSRHRRNNQIRNSTQSQICSDILMNRRRRNASVVRRRYAQNRNSTQSQLMGSPPPRRRHRNSQNRNEIPVNSANTNGDSPKSENNDDSQQMQPTETNSRDRTDLFFGDCPICFEPLGRNPLASTKCGHVFCLKCLERAVRFSKKCPSCRTGLNHRTGYHPLYFSKTFSTGPGSG